MVDDLESLLSSVESSATFDSAAEQSVRDKERLARRGDRTLVDVTSGNAESDFRQRIHGIATEKSLDPFRKGYIQAFSAHNEYASSFRTYTIEKDLTEEVISALRKYRYSWEKSIGNIEKNYTEFITTCNPEMLMKEAKHDFNMEFPDKEMSTARLNFIVLKNVFLKAREYNSRFRKDWEDLSKGIGALNMVSDGKALFILCNTLVGDALKFCESTDQFVKFLAAMLAIPQVDIDVLSHELPNKTFFFESYDYVYEKELQCESVKSIDYDFLDLSTSGKAEGTVSIEDRSSDTKDVIVGVEQRVADSVIPAAIAIPFTVKGTSVWNTREPYVIKIDHEKLIKDYKDLENSIYYNAEIPDNMKVGGQVKRAMIHFLRDSSHHIMREYEEFLFRIVPVKVNEAAEFFGINKDNLWLFAYHLAPLTMHRILIDHFTSTGQGLCYKLHQDKRVSRYVPSDFVKEKILLW
ncbi:MAG TPA: hypothetical protein PKK43_12340, partial [Spirochaetota bacterium]|nr:hypothetical protein [Spirochaetota bacterium]